MPTIRQLVRGISRRLGSSLVMVGLCALGVGLSTTIFAVLHNVLLNPLPYPESDRLVKPWCVAESFGVDRYPFSWDNYRDYRDQLKSFESLAATRTVAMTLDGPGRPTSVAGARITANLLQVLRVEPVLGRGFGDDEERVALISHGLWQRLFGGEGNAIGRTIRVDGEPHSIIGVLPSHHRYPTPESEVFVPLIITEPPESERAFHFLRLVGRLAPGWSLEDAEAEMQTLAGHLSEAYPDANSALGARIIPLKEEIIGSSGRSLATLFSAVQLLFLIAWVNVAILLLVRGMARRGELELRPGTRGHEGPPLAASARRGVPARVGRVSGRYRSRFYRGHQPRAARLGIVTSCRRGALYCVARRVGPSASPWAPSSCSEASPLGRRRALAKPTPPRLAPRTSTRAVSVPAWSRFRSHSPFRCSSPRTCSCVA